MLRAHILISGFVQGVGFRYFIKDKADELGLSGWVKNTSDGRVEAVIEGPNDKAEEMITLCRKGPYLTVVSDMKVERTEAIGNFADFTIKFD